MSSEAITATATTMVAEAITAAHGELDRKGHLSPTRERKTIEPAGATSDVKRDTAVSAPVNDAAVGGAPGDWKLGSSPRPVKPGGDLRGSFLAAVGNTISLTVRMCSYSPAQCSRADRK